MGTKYRFLSHPVEENTSLVEHSLKVAEKAKELISSTNFDKNVCDAAFYAGFLHDLGKLNPFYQNLFSTPCDKRSDVEKELGAKYARMHSILSAWAASKLLSNRILTEQNINAVLVAIAAHHSGLKKLEQFDTEEQQHLKESKEGMFKNLEEYFSEIKVYPCASELDFDKCMKKFNRPIYFDRYTAEKENALEDYLTVSCIFSALLQSDKGSFNPWKTPKFDLVLSTEKLVRKGSKLSDLRTAFQTSVFSGNDFKGRILILKAPTGIGKTKIFLDLAVLLAKRENLERVFYFSPLLALTEDFENKLDSIIDKSAKKDVLVYNHLFSRTLAEKDEEKEATDYLTWNFEAESFNKKMIVTTTQRLLITLYSNKAYDKIKLLSFKNSLLIVDEVQTIPKFLLPNLLSMLKKISERLNSKILLVSATIPDQLKGVQYININEKIAKEYLKKTRKEISFKNNFNVREILPKPDTNILVNILVMVNTRRKACELYKLISNGSTYPNVVYISSGIRKSDRTRIINHIKNEPGNIVVSTQVLEAGVDISFSKIYREVAPLDNIVQVLGRLNREMENKESSRMLVFKIDANNRPYSELEFRASEKILSDIKDSCELYEKLPDYYKDVLERNEENKEKADCFESLFQNCDYEKIWNTVNKDVLSEGWEDTVFIPDKSTPWKELKRDLLRSRRKLNLQKWGGLTANLPISPFEQKIRNLFDDELFEKDILLPKEDCIDKIYDKNLGLDKWIQK